MTVAIPGTYQLTVTTAKHPVPHRCSEGFWNWPFVLDGQVADAFPRIELIGRNKGVCRADIQASRTGPTAGTLGHFSDGQRTVGEDFPEKKPAAAISREQ